MANMIYRENYIIWCGRVIGLVGMLCLIGGNLVPVSATRAGYFVAGCILLLIPPIIEFNPFFISLQIVALSGAIMYFFDSALWVKALIPMIFVALSSTYFYRNGMLRDPLTAFGNLGVAILALGYGIVRAEVYFVGGLILTIYSSINFKRGVSIAILWAIANLFFCIASLYAIMVEWGFI